MRKIVKGILITIVIILGIGIGGVFYLARGLETVQEEEVKDIEVLQLEEGTYYGRYDQGRWRNEVEVTILDNKIIDINFVEDVVFKDESVQNQLIQKVIEEQSVLVDTISGATVTSKAYLKSIENALDQ
ncbi:uncharacterized protein with FMN-binding domain [Natranaerovirga hydrolytica]|uniref:Uncharacterized protein with FMN-binding domain n=1 Tax=Natranaerovirga hydrolytica TaxID=680378 RepID=A0A4R1MJ85_9FIRM|nr:FMN-binding protein [Natranaerovirga hydrolytica]TCK92838.1 uncharacterized protein with FMN-binding domain [Natranaerovirga hydrolytica]